MFQPNVKAKRVFCLARLPTVLRVGRCGRHGLGSLRDPSPCQPARLFARRPSVLPSSPPYRWCAVSAAGRGLTKAPNLTSKLTECFAWLASLPFSALAAAGGMGSGRCATRAHASPHGFSRGDRAFCLARHPTDCVLCPPPDAS